MPRITDRHTCGGASDKIVRLGLQTLWAELEDVLTGFPLLVEEARDANGGASVRSTIDARFEAKKGWKKKQSGDVDWVKCYQVNGTRVCIGVEIQFSARSDLLIVDVAHLREQINAGEIDVGVLVVPNNKLAVFLTDRGPNFSAAKTAIDRARAEDLPIIILGLEHDGPGPPLVKQRTRQGKAPAEGD